MTSKNRMTKYGRPLTHLVILAFIIAVLNYLSPDSVRLESRLYIILTVFVGYFSLVLIYHKRVQIIEFIKTGIILWKRLYGVAKDLTVLLIFQNLILIFGSFHFIYGVRQNRFELDWISLLTLVGFAQLVLCAILVFQYVLNRDYVQKLSINDILRDKVAKIAINPNLVNQNNHFQQAKERVKMIQTLWVILLSFWILMYAFLLSIDYFDLWLGDEFSRLLMRILNILDTVVFLLLFAFFRVPEPNIKYKHAFANVWKIFLILFIVIGFDIYSFLWADSLQEQTLQHFILIGAVLSSFAFLAFFGKLDSLLIRIPQEFLFVLILYGLLQSVFPFVLQEVQSETNNSLFHFIAILSVPILLLGKLVLGILLMSKHFIRRLMIYFTRIFLYG